MKRKPRVRNFLIGILLVAVAVIVTAFAIGGNGSTGSGGVGGAVSTRSAVGNGEGSPGQAPQQLAGIDGAAHAAVPRAAPSGVSGALATGQTGSGATITAALGGGVTGTRVVKTGSLSLTVPKGHVQSAVSQLVQIAGSLGGYVSQTSTDNVAGSPTGEVTLRVPVARFEEAIGDAEKIGHETALTTNAHDVTGKFVDLNARLGALQRTRQTYLTILGHATTIGQTLSIQQRIQDVQQQIEQVQGSLKVLRNQSTDGTLTVDVTQTGSAAAVTHHKHGGIGAAWHKSVSRFTRGFDAIVSALGPLLLAAILLALVGLAVRFAVRRTRRATT